MPFFLTHIKTIIFTIIAIFIITLCLLVKGLYANNIALRIKNTALQNTQQVQTEVLKINDNFITNDKILNAKINTIKTQIINKKNNQLTEEEFIKQSNIIFKNFSQPYAPIIDIITNY